MATIVRLTSMPPTLQRAITEDDRDSVRIELRAQDLDMPADTDISVRDLRPRLLTFRLKRKDNLPRSVPAAVRPRKPPP